MPYESFAFDLLRPRWVKIRDQWWGEFLITIFCLSICGPYVYYKIWAIDQVDGVLGWAIYGVTFAIALYMIVYTVRGLYGSIRRRSQLIHRWRRSKSRTRRKDTT